MRAYGNKVHCFVFYYKPSLTALSAAVCTELMFAFTSKHGERNEYVLFFLIFFSISPPPCPACFFQPISILYNTQPFHFPSMSIQGPRHWRQPPRAQSSEIFEDLQTFTSNGWMFILNLVKSTLIFKLWSWNIETYFYTLKSCIRINVVIKNTRKYTSL